MKTLILSNHSEKIEELNALTAPNKFAYAAHHGFDFENPATEYNTDGHVGFLKTLRAALDEYDAVMTIGCDTLYTNFAKTPERVIEWSPEHSVFVCREAITFWPINNDVMIWRNEPGAIYLVDKIIADAQTWLKYPWLWQNHLWNLLQTDARACEVTRLMDPRAMNSTHQPTLENQRLIGPSSWQMGDWIVHFLNYSIPNKVKLAQEYLKFVSIDGTWKPAPKFEVMIKPQQETAQ